MTTGHKFRIGQVVGLKAPLSDAAGGHAAAYKILRLLPRTGLDWSYCVKTITEPDERFANEDELVLHSALAAHTVTHLP